MVKKHKATGHYCPVTKSRYVLIQRTLTEDHLHRDWSYSGRLRLADDIDGLATSAADPGPESIVMEVDDLRSVAELLRTVDSFSPSALLAKIASCVEVENDDA